MFRVPILLPFVRPTMGRPRWGKGTLLARPSAADDAVDGTQAINPLKIYWWLVVFPAGAMGSTLLALNLLGDGLRDALDPKLRGRT